MAVIRDEDNILDSMLPNPYGLNEYPAKGNIHYRTNKPQKPTKRTNKLSKYRSSIRTLIPIRKKRGDDGIIPVDNIGCISTIFFSWISPLMWKGYREGLDAEDVYKCPITDGCFRNGARLCKMWKTELDNNGPEKASLIKVLFAFLKTRIIIQCILFTCVIILGVLAPAYFMLNILKYIEDGGAGGITVGILWALGLTLVEVIRTTTMTGLWSIALRSATRLRSACMHLLYIKIFKMADTREKSIGQLVNMFGNDAATVYDAPLYIPLIIGGPLMIIAGFIYVYLIIGPFSLVGMSMFLLFYPFQVLIAKFIGIFRKKTLKSKDERSTRMTELINSIKLIKLYAWENIFFERISDIRKQEKKSIRRGQFLQSISLSLAPAVPVLAAFVTFIIHIAFGGDLTASQAFTTLTLYYIIGMAVRTLPHEIKTVMHTKISLDRIKDVLTLPELVPYVLRLEENNPDAVVMYDASLSWNIQKAESHLIIYDKTLHTSSISSADRSDVPMLIDKDSGYNRNFGEKHDYILNDISLRIKKNSLVAVIGPTGCGKSSLLSAIIGKMALLRGSVSIGGSCAYVAQQPWIMNSTLRENIILDEDFDAKRYYQVLHSCELTEDVSKLPGGDNTYVGDRGIRLSGGQKLRVCLARAIYSGRDIYLLDDCFSAIDQNVASKIFKNVVKNILCQKTVILVTHSVQFLEYCDEVVVMRSGSVTDVGSHENLLQTSDSYSSLIENFESLQKAEEISEVETSPNVDSGAENMMADDYLDESESDDEESIASANIGNSVEKIEHGHISSYTYKNYILKSGGYISAAIVVLTLAVNVGWATFSSWWLSKWISAGNGNITACINSTDTHCKNRMSDNPDSMYYQTVYAVSVGFVFLTNILRAVIFTKVTIKASTTMHDELFKKLLKSPIKFFDYTPIGRTLNLFTKDQEVVDCRLPLRLEILLQYFLIIAFALMIVIFVIPWMILVITIFALLFYFTHKIFHNAVRDIKRLQNTTWPAVFSHVATSVHGIDTIRVHSKQDAFVDRFDKLYDRCSAPLYLFNSANRWIGLRLELIAICITTVTTILAVVLRDRITPSLAGLALSYTIQFCTYFQYMVRTMNQTEADFTSFERQLMYSENFQDENKPLNRRRSSVPEADQWRQPKNLWSDSWPTRGRVSFKGVCMRYQPCLLPVLKSVTFDAYPGEKIGIIGRTGAGKSSLGVVLFRLVEISSGLIYIDGIDISTLPLKEVRSRLSIIPQDPVLFHGTLRENLDPINQFTDLDLWKALEKTSMKSKIVSLKGHLRALVDENGRNFSVGERQLLCLTRAVLKSSKVILLDEATASIDVETDTLIQRTLQECFVKSTVLTIAHRLHSVQYCDKILVMHDGRVAEFDEPRKLLANPRSRFSVMVAASSNKDLFN